MMMVMLMVMMMVIWRWILDNFGIWGGWSRKYWHLLKVEASGRKHDYDDDDDDENDDRKIMMKKENENWHLLKVEASGGKEAPASLLLSLNGVDGDSDGSVAANSQVNMIMFCLVWIIILNCFTQWGWWLWWQCCYKFENYSTISLSFYHHISIFHSMQKQMLKLQCFLFLPFFSLYQNLFNI